MKSVIFKIIRSLDQNAIAAMTSPSFYQSGKSLFENGKVIAFTWFKNNSELCALIRGSSTAHQILAKIGKTGKIEYTCNCPAWNNILQCHHVVCALLTISNLLNDRKIPGFGTALKVQLQGSNKNSPGLEETIVEVKPKNPIGVLLQARHLLDHLLTTTLYF